MIGLIWPMVVARCGPGRAGDITDTADLIAGLASANLPSNKDAALERRYGPSQAR